MIETTHYPDIVIRTVEVNGITINVATSGTGPAVLLLHGWPHTWQLWRNLFPFLTTDYRVIAPDLRGIGATTLADNGYDLHTLADDAAALLKALDVEQASVVGIDLGVSIATMLALRHPARTRHLIVTEGLVGKLPGAEAFLANGAPWWFGFHGTPGLAESVLEDYADRYIDWFLINGTADRKGIDPAIRDAFVAAYQTRERLRGGFEHYRAFPVGARQLAEAVAQTKLSVPILALAGGVVGTAVANQLRPVSADLSTGAIENCGHLVPLEQPQALAVAIHGFIA
ncbi:alpha/beta fold hydrolase [Erwinia amylovora]